MVVCSELFRRLQDMPSGCGLENNDQFGDMSILNGNKWGWDFPVGHQGCWNANRTIDDDTKAQWRTEFGEIVQEHLYSPCIVLYQVILNLPPTLNPVTTKHTGVKLCLMLNHQVRSQATK